jgi:LacI family repressor for deo operon, udp, cdd, tsx, nupC, and nupG
MAVKYIRLQIRVDGKQAF